MLSIFNLNGGTAQSGRSHCSIQAEPLLNFAGRGDFAERRTHLCHAIDIAIEHQPDILRMQVLCDEVCMRTGKRTASAVSKALNRAAKDIWQNGKRDKLREYWIEDAPTAKELVLLISSKLWADRLNR